MHIFNHLLNVCLSLTITWCGNILEYKTKSIQHFFSASSKIIFCYFINQTVTLIYDLQPGNWSNLLMEEFLQESALFQLLLTHTLNSKSLILPLWILKLFHIINWEWNQKIPGGSESAFVHLACSQDRKSTHNCAW